MVYNNPGWDPQTFVLDRDVAAADAATGDALNATDPNLREFRKHGGKLILFQGWSDPAIAAQSTINYYDSVVSERGAMRGEDFVRLFMAPGMQHCQDGPGPDSFGQNGFAQGDPASDLEAALEQWVEAGVAPEQVVATKFAGSSVVRTRPLCAFPAVAEWTGSGSTDDAANFTCVTAEGGRKVHGPGR
jgi:feruloyl esterase